MPNGKNCKVSYCTQYDTKSPLFCNLYTNLSECTMHRNGHNSIGDDVEDKADKVSSEPDAVDHPSHYTAHPSGVECIQITQHMNFCMGNALKYLWRAGLKGDASEDLRKAAKYIEFELARINTKKSED